MIKEIIKAFLPRWYICEPPEYAGDKPGPAARVKVWAWSPQGARMKAYDALQCENIQVREYEQ